jgi:hypothetical protein
MSNLDLIPDRRPDTIVAVSLHCPRCDGGTVGFLTFLQSLVVRGNESKLCPRCLADETTKRPRAHET